MTNNTNIIALDGPAASGKSTVAIALAKRLGFAYLDTGAMYRAMTVKVLEEGLDPEHETAVAELSQIHHIKYQTGDELAAGQVYVDDDDVTAKIRAPRVNESVSAVSRVKEVRQVMVAAQRDFAIGKDVVVEGRDIGTVVFPDAMLKVFLVASPRERARRRQGDLRALGVDIDLDTLEDQIAIRDDKDSLRAVSPLTKADDAICIDTTEKTINQIVDEIVEIYEMRTSKAKP